MPAAYRLAESLTQALHDAGYALDVVVLRYDKADQRLEGLLPEYTYTRGEPRRLSHNGVHGGQLSLYMRVVKVEIEVVAPQVSVGFISAVDDKRIAVGIYGRISAPYNAVKAAVGTLAPPKALAAVERLPQVEVAHLFKNNAHIILKKQNSK